MCGVEVAAEDTAFRSCLEDDQMFINVVKVVADAGLWLKVVCGKPGNKVLISQHRCGRVPDDVKWIEFGEDDTISKEFYFIPSQGSFTAL